MSPAALPEHDLCLSLRVFLAGGEEDVYDKVLVPDSPQVYASLSCFGTHLLKLLQKTLPLVLTHFLLFFFQSLAQLLMLFLLQFAYSQEFLFCL